MYIESPRTVAEWVWRLGRVALLSIAAGLLLLLLLLLELLLRLFNKKLPLEGEELAVGVAIPVVPVGVGDEPRKVSFWIFFQLYLASEGPELLLDPPEEESREGGEGDPIKTTVEQQES